MRKLQFLTDIRKKIRPHITRKRVTIAGVIVLLGLLLTPIATYAYFSRDIANRERLMNRKSTGIVIRDRNGETIYSYGRVTNGDEATLEEISDFTEKALIASEDEGFYKHQGYSLRGIAGAMVGNILNKDATRYGGSTLTQQLVKNNLLSSSKNFFRKYQEVSMAIAIERQYSKDDILEMYLNSVYFGEGAFGIEQAAKIYFNKSAADLNLAESSLLVGLLPAPSAYSPVSGDAEKAERQQARVLKRMVEVGSITNEERDAAATQMLAYSSDGVTTQNYAQHFAMMVLDELNETYGEERMTRSGFDVTTSLDLNWQKKAEQYVRERINELTRQGATNAGLVAIDPKNGQIRALVGSVDWNNPEFGKVNMALVPRQPGSSFKPLYYAEAMDRRLITAATILDDKSKTYGGTYKPENYDRRYRGKVSVRNSLAQSLNIPSVDVMQKLGPTAASQAVREMGVSDVTEPQKYGLSLALGTAETKLLEMTNAYAAFANEGRQFDPVMITSIKDKFDDTVFEAKSKPKQVISPEASFLISSVLSDNKAREPIFGSRLTIRNREVAVKTGTTNDNKDAWTIGYTPNLAIGVWVGDNKHRPMTGVAGSSGAAPIWMRSMNAFLGNSTSESFRPTSSIQKLSICIGTDLRADKSGSNTFEEYFIKGTEPSGKCNSQEQEEEKKPEENKDDKKREDEENQNTDEDDDASSGTGGDEPDESEEDEEPPTTQPVTPGSIEPQPTNSGPGSSRRQRPE